MAHRKAFGIPNDPPQLQPSVSHLFPCPCCGSTTEATGHIHGTHACFCARMGKGCIEESCHACVLHTCPHERAPQENDEDLENYGY